VTDGNLVRIDEALLHEAIFGILNQLSETYHETPGEWSMSLQALKQDLSDLFLSVFIVWLNE